jgi:hypothetical protein
LLDQATAESAGAGIGWRDRDVDRRGLSRRKLISPHLCGAPKEPPTERWLSSTSKAPSPPPKRRARCAPRGVLAGA